MQDVEGLLARLKVLMHTPIKEVVDKRIDGFGKVNDKFGELCFCVLTANSSAGMCIKLQKNLQNAFHTSNKEELRARLKKYGYRFPNRAEYICYNRGYRDIDKILKNFSDGRMAREWFVENIKGFGYKEASHFLRNIGYKNLAILDRHILRVMKRYKLMEEVPKILNKREYIGIEKKLEEVADKLGITLSKLDLYLWYMETGKILK